MDERAMRDLARKRILGALDEVVAQLTAQAALLERQDGAAPLLVTDEVARWVERLSLALARYMEGAYARAAELADITGVDDGQRTADDGRQTADDRL